MDISRYRGRQVEPAGSNEAQTVDVRLVVGSRMPLDSAAAHDLFRVDLAYRLVAGRPPQPKELQQSAAFLQSQSPREFALAMLNLNAFLYVN